MDQSHGRIYLFTIFGTRALSSEAKRPVHNRVAGNPEDVAAAKSLGDLSHMVYTHWSLLYWEPMRAYFRKGEVSA